MKRVATLNEAREASEAPETRADWAMGVDHAHAKGAMGAMLVDFYTLMGVAPTATREEILQAYQALTIRLQPDARPGSAAAARIQLLDEAYRVLASPPLRAEYDAQRQLDQRDAAKATPSLAASPAMTPTNPPPRGAHRPPARAEEPGAPPRLSVTLGAPIALPLEEPERFYILAELGPSSATTIPPAAPLNLAVVVSRSMSQLDPDLAETRYALDALGALLRPEDRLTLVAFDERPSVLLDGASVAGQEGLGEALESVEPYGDARLSSALALALERLAAHSEPTRVSTLALITDGSAAGDEARCLDLAERARQLGAPIVMLGVGLDWNRGLCDQIASATGGTCAFVDNPRYLTHALADLVERLQATFASRPRLTLEPAPGVSVLRAGQIAPGLTCVFEGPHTPGAPVTVELGALAGGPEARASAAIWETLLEPSTLSLSADGEVELGNVHSAYWALWQDGGRMVRVGGAVRTRLVNDPPAAPPADIRLAMELLTACRLQERADQLAASGHVMEASEALNTAALRLASAGDANLAAEARQAAAALAQGQSHALAAALRARYSVRNHSPFHHLRRARDGKAGG